jgi:hypothetical protein
MMRTIKPIVAFVAILVLMDQACALAEETPKSGTQMNYSWQLNDADAAHLFKQIKLLKYADLISKVRDGLGTPTKEGDTFDKKGNFLAYELLYAIKRVKPEGGNVYDQEVSLDFDTEGRLFQIEYNAMSPLTGDIIRNGTEPLTGVQFFITKPPLSSNISR